MWSLPVIVSPLLLIPAPAGAQLLEVRQTIFGMD
jgi:hypothetical protein